MKGVIETAADVSAGRQSAASLVGEALARIDEGDGRIRAFLEVTGDQALAEARAVDARVAAGESLPLAGVALALKDNIWVAGRHDVRFEDGRLPAARDSTVAARLRRRGPSSSAGPTWTSSHGFVHREQREPRGAIVRHLCVERVLRQQRSRGGGSSCRGPWLGHRARSASPRPAAWSE
jgi:hypothetical protein